MNFELSFPVSDGCEGHKKSWIILHRNGYPVWANAKTWPNFRVGQGKEYGSVLLGLLGAL